MLECRCGTRWLGRKGSRTGRTMAEVQGRHRVDGPRGIWWMGVCNRRGHHGVVSWGQGYHQVAWVQGRHGEGGGREVAGGCARKTRGNCVAGGCWKGGTGVNALRARAAVGGWRAWAARTLF